MKRGPLAIGIGTFAAVVLGGGASAAARDDTRSRDVASSAPDSGGARLALAADEAATVRLNGFSQFRYVLNFRDDPPPQSNGDHDSGFTNGFENARTRLTATGEMFGGDLAFIVEGEWLPNGETFFFLNGYADSRLDSRHTLRVGQFRLPLWREWSVEESRQLAANASLMTEAINPGYTQGVALLYTDDRVRFHSSMNDGIRASNTPFDSPGEADIAFAGRFDVKGSSGDWSLFDDFTGWRGQPRAWMAGLGVVYHHGGATSATDGVTQQTLLEVAADLSFEGPGWNGYLAGVLVHTGPDTADIRITDWGAVAHAGYFVTNAVEVFGRWDGIFPDKARGGGVKTAANTITAGANWYLFPKSHAAKFTGDVQWFMDPSFNNGIVRPIIDGSNAVVRSDREGNQFTLRFQFQFVF